MRLNKYIGIMMLAVGMQAATSCSDFKDYNEAYVDPNTNANLTLWENIKANQKLTKFATLVERAGFKDELLASNYYTVWAPTDDAINLDDYTNADSTEILNKFIKNHITNYSHQATGVINDRIYVLNDKVYTFEYKEGAYNFGDMQIIDANIPATNGVLHTLNGTIPYYPNIYAYLFEMEGADSIKNMFKQYDFVELDVDKSIIGPIVNGQQTYIDSVMNRYNTLANRLRANIENEDSTYTVIIPTDEAWMKQYTSASKYYNYVPKMYFQTLTDANNSIDESGNISVQAEYYKDSLARQTTSSALFFNNNDVYNRWILDETAPFIDSIKTTTGKKYSNPKDMLAQVKGEPVKMSNGIAYMVDSIAIKPWELFAGSRSYTATNYRARVLSGSAVSREGEQINEWGLMEDFRYMYIEPSSKNAKPELDILLPEVLSTEYRFYVVVVPAVLFEPNTTDTLPNFLKFELSYADAGGNLAKHTFDATALAADSLWHRPLETAPANKVGFMTDPTVMDTIYIGNFEFPSCYYGLRKYNSNCAPNIKITSPFNAFSSAFKSKYTRSLRIAGVILKPVELVEYEIANGIVKQ